jgi:hypothetical protein
VYVVITSHFLFALPIDFLHFPSFNSQLTRPVVDVGGVFLDVFFCHYFFHFFYLFVCLNSLGSLEISNVDDFEYTDPTNGQVTSKQARHKMMISSPSY